MIREDIEIKPWSSARFVHGEQRYSVIGFRMSPTEEQGLNDATFEASKRAGIMLRPTDIVRSCLIFCGVFPKPTTQEKEEASNEGQV